MRSLMILAMMATAAQAGPLRRAGVRCAPLQVVSSSEILVVPKPVAVPVVPVVHVLAPTSQPAAYGAAQYRPPLRDPGRLEAAQPSQGLADLTRAVSLLLSRVEALEGKFGPPVAGGLQIPQIVSQQCGTCHDGTGGESGITFADIAGAANDKAQLSVMKGSMPKRGDEAEPIPAEIRTALVQALEGMKK